MKLKFLAVALLSVPIAACFETFAQTSYQKGKALFDNGMYDRAAVLFDEADDPLSEAYSILCG
ncbi:MAG: hypothetical protein MJY51_03520, partial [Bacteroidales bacterium]|nr:hypothetical protein [Bacteroidales bacterium]